MLHCREDSKLKAASYGEPVGEHAKRRGNFRPQVAPSGKLCRTQKRVTLVLKCHAWGLQGRQLDRVVKCILLDHTTNPSTLTLHLVVKCILLDHTLEKEQEFQCYDAALLLRLLVSMTLEDNLMMLSVIKCVSLAAGSYAAQAARHAAGCMNMRGARVQHLCRVGRAFSTLQVAWQAAGSCAAQAARQAARSIGAHVWSTGAKWDAFSTLQVARQAAGSCAAQAARQAAGCMNMRGPCVQ
eukprot:1161079-Pelagomonas_calceolata.AAC.4